MRRAVVVFPGRGSYSRESLGMLKDIESTTLVRLDAYRSEKGEVTPTELDGASRFSSRKHIAGEQASLLTAACALADIDQLCSDKVSIVGACGNSMGWYTTLASSGVLSLEDAATLIDTLGGYQADSLIGGQLVYPLTDPDWRMSSELYKAVERCVSQHSELFWSIRLGAQAVLGGSEDGIKFAMKTLPAQESKGRTFPLRLPLHAAFHTPLMRDTSTRAQGELSGLKWNPPKWPIVDGHGNLWHPHHASPEAIREYTLGPQIHEVFDFSLMLKTLLGETGPDLIILPGPGTNLGGAIAQVLISQGWSQIQDRNDFVARQKTDPVLFALGRPEQRTQVTR